MRESQMTVRACQPGPWTCSCSRPATEGHDSGALQLLQLPTPALCGRPSAGKAHDSGGDAASFSCLLSAHASGVLWERYVTVGHCGCIHFAW